MKKCLGGADVGADLSGDCAFEAVDFRVPNALAGFVGKNAGRTHHAQRIVEPPGKQIAFRQAGQVVTQKQRLTGRFISIDTLLKTANAGLQVAPMGQQRTLVNACQRRPDSEIMLDRNR